VDILAYYGDIKTAAAVFAVDPGLADDRGAFGSAPGNDHAGFVRLMLRHRPSLITRVSCAGKSRELTEYLFQRGMPATLADWLGITTLHGFAEGGHIENATLFIDHGADLRARDEDLCSTPLGWAAKAGQVEMVELLLARGAQPNLPDDRPWATPLAWAMRRGHPAVVEVLEKAGAK
jgi:uncharacterized protein